MEALDDLKVATKKCVTDMEEQRKQMFQVAKKMVRLRDGFVNQKPSLPSLAKRKSTSANGAQQRFPFVQQSG
jgi:hypothetical protein